MFARKAVMYCWHWSRLFQRMATGAHVILDTVTFPWRALLSSCCSNTSKWHQTDEVDSVPLQSAVRWAHTDMKSEGSPFKANARWDTCGKKVHAEVANLQASKRFKDIRIYTDTGQADWAMIWSQEATLSDRSFANSMAMLLQHSPYISSGNRLKLTSQANPLTLTFASLNNVRSG